MRVAPVGWSRRRGPATGGSGRALRVLAPTTVLACYLLVVLGDTVRVTESGMGCRSWPLCNGHIGLSGVYEALLEQSHRYAAAAVTMLVLATFVAVWRSADRDRLAYRAAAAGVALIGAQVLLGAITVFAHNAGWTVALHLAGAWLLLAAVTVTAVRVLHPAEPSGAPTLAHGLRPGRAPALAAVAGVFLLSVSGMLVLHEGASRACASWPLCLGSPAPLRLVLLQYAHRMLAFGATVAVAWAAVRLWRSTPARSPRRLAAGGVLALLAATVALGGIVATSGATPLAQDLHLAAASAFWVGAVVLAALSGCAPLPRT
jgi:cytochrome c oxidase assembly protein subunit 15